MFVLLFLIVLHYLHATDPTHLKPGALTAPLGQVALVEDYLWVRYPYSSLVTVPYKLSELTKQLTVNLETLDSHVVAADRYPHNLKLILKDRLNYLRGTLENALENYEDLSSIQGRTKRGLVDGLGQISRMLFGTALDSEVKDLQHRYNQLIITAEATNRTVRLNCRNIERLDNNVQVVFNYTNQLRSSINLAFANLNKLYAFNEVSLVLTALETSITSILHANELILRNIVDASRGKVTSSLLPVKDLLHVLTTAENNYTLIPIFSKHNILHYYPLLSSMLTSDAVVVHVPFQSSSIYNLYQIEPFPFKSNATLFTLNIPSSLVLTDDNFASYSVGGPQNLLHCQSEHAGLYYCPASLFAFVPAKEEGVCELALIQKDASRSFSLCPYTQLAPKPYFHKSFMGHHYFFFPKPMFVSIKCVTGSLYSRVEGHFSILKVCSLSSTSVTTHHETVHKGFVANIFKRIYNLKINISSIKYVTNSISELSFANYSELESAVHETLPTYLQPYVHYPSLISVFIIILVLLITLYCLVRRVYNVYRFPKCNITHPSTGPDTSV